MADDKQTNAKPVENPTLEKGKDLGGDEAQAKMDRETAQGFSGMDVDPTPNRNYSVGGVTANKPTPETDPKAAAKAEAETAPGVGRFRGVETEPREPAKQVTLTNNEGREITVSEKLKSNYPDYKEKK